MQRLLLSAGLLLSACSAEEYLLTPPPFDAARKTAVLALIPEDPDLPPARIEAFDLEVDYPQFGFRSDIIGVSGAIFALGYDESLEELELTLGAVDTPVDSVPCARIRPAETLSYALSEGAWNRQRFSAGVEEFMRGPKPCQEPSSCLNPRFTVATTVPSDYAMKLFHRLGPDRFLTGGGAGFSVVTKDGIESDLPAFWATLPRGRTAPATDGRVWMYEGNQLLLVDLDDETRTEDFSFGSLNLVGVGQSPDGGKVLALLSSQSSSVPPPYDVQVWLHESGQWRELFEVSVQQGLLPTTSPVAWTSNNEAFLSQRGVLRSGLLLHYRNGIVSLEESVPGPAGVVVDDKLNVFVGSTNGQAYHRRSDGTWRNLGGVVGDSLHGMLALDEGVLIAGFAGVVQEVYLDEIECQPQSLGDGIVPHIKRNGDGLVLGGVEPSYVVWTD